MGLANLIRGLLALRLWDAALGWSLALPLPLLGGFYFLVGFTFTLSAFLIRFGKGLSFVLPLAVLYQLALWVIRWVGYRSAYARSQWARDLLLTGLFLALVTLLVRSTPSGRAGEEET
ncbi:MAG: hypothetical protein ACLFU8_05225 [Anaerolineales bacterium]